MKLALALVLVLLGYCTAVLFPFFPSQFTSDGVDNGCTSEIPLVGSFPFFGGDYTSYMVGYNGIVSFGGVCTPQGDAPNFPFSSSSPIVAPLWADTDYEVDVPGSNPASAIYYGSNTGPSPIDGIVTGFTAQEYIISTWFSAPYFDDQVDKYNSFQ